MARPIVLVALVGAMLSGANAQDSACAMPPDIRALTLQQVRSRLADGHAGFFLYQRLLDVTPIVPKPGSLAPEFARLLAGQPADARFLYLYGRSLIGKNTPEAIVQLNRAAATAPALPWTWFALADIYASTSFKDLSKMAESARAYRQLCPSNLDGFLHLKRIANREESAAWARELRPLLERSADPEAPEYWRMLWAAEFRTTPQAGYDALRATVAADVKRLESLTRDPADSLLETLRDGYQLSGQAEAAQRIGALRDARPDPNGDANRVSSDWLAKAGLRGGHLTPEEARAAYRKYAEAAREWTSKWPDSSVAWCSRLSAVAGAPGSTREELETVGRRCLTLLDAQPPAPWTFVQPKFAVARQWVRYGVRLKDAVAIAEEALDQILLGPEEPNDLKDAAREEERLKSQQYGFDVSLWDAMATVVDGAIQLQDFKKAEAMLQRMQAWLQANQFKKDDATSGYPSFQARYLQSTARVADAEGHKIDAVALYAKAIAAGFLALASPDFETHARALWDELGGTSAGWAVATARLPAPRPPEQPPVTVATAFAGWSKVDLPLPDASLQDSLGKPWSVAALKGKITFIAVFATWCVPCRDELPQVQKLYELSRQHDSFRVMALSVDENPGEVRPFLEANGYTFPVILARSYIKRIAGSAIPQSWIVDPAATLREKSSGFDSALADWPGKMAERIAPYLR
jgi:thiol-disulfide isomerase/thioredoxin